MRIFIGGSILRPSWTGGEPLVVRQLVAGLQSSGHEVLTGGLPGSLLRLISMGTSPVDWDIRSVGQYRRLIQRAHPDAVLGFYDYDMSLCEATVRERVPYIACVHIHWPVCPIGVLYIDGEGTCNGPGLKKCLRHMSSGIPDARMPMVGSSLPPLLGLGAYAKFAARPSSLAKASAIIVPSQSAKATLAHAGFRRIQVVSNSVDTKEFPFTAIPVGDTKRVLLPSGSSSERKGLTQFRAAAAKLRSRRSDAQFVATNHPGDGVIDGTPYLARSQVVQEYVRSYAVVVPVLWDEPFGIVLIEAMAAGRPVVAFDAGAVREIVDHGRTGLVVPRGDTQALADAIERLLEQPSLATSMGQNARERAEREFSVEKMIRGYLDVIESVAADPMGGDSTP